MKSYVAKEVFKTLQGEGFHAGRAAVFIRFSGCNLWNGKGDGRPAGLGSCSAWCDTDFVGTDGAGGGRYAAAGLAAKAGELWGDGDRASRFAVLTGGEPMLQVDPVLIDALHRFGFEVALETNGTIPIRFHSLDWVTVSPKAGSELAQRHGQELKLVYPQAPALDPGSLVDLPFRHRFLQPRDGPELGANTAAAVEYCLAHPGWRLSLQRHKVWGIS